MPLWRIPAAYRQKAECLRKPAGRKRFQRLRPRGSVWSACGLPPLSDASGRTTRHAPTVTGLPRVGTLPRFDRNQAKFVTPSSKRTCSRSPLLRPSVWLLRLSSRQIHRAWIPCLRPCRRRPDSFWAAFLVILAAIIGDIKIRSL